MPSMSAPSETRKRQWSCTCGSQAALAMIVSPRASVAAMIAFSVPVTEASSRKMEAPASRSALMWKRRLARMSATSWSMVSTSRMAGTFVSVTGSSARRAAAMMGSAAFLLPAARIDPERGRPPSITKDSIRASDTTVSGTAGPAIVRGPLEVTRDRAWETPTRYTKSEALRRHALAVEACVGAYARQLGEDEAFWRATALLHDFDYEMHPTLGKHPQDGAPILREEG